MIVFLKVITIHEYFFSYRMSEIINFKNWYFKKLNNSFTGGRASLPVKVNIVGMLYGLLLSLF